MNDQEMTPKESGEMGAEFVLTRDFDAPRELVWKMWTEPEMMKLWYGPADFTAPVMESDFREGGRFLYDMRGPDGKDYWSSGEFREIVPPERLVSTDNFSDEKGNPVPPSYYGLPGDEPLERVVTVTFDEIAPGKTRFTVRAPSAGNQEEERAGWDQMLDKFEEQLRMAKAA